MATEYSYEMGEPATPDGVTDVFARAADLYGLTEEVGVGFARPGAILRSGVLVSVFKPSPMPFPHPVEETFGFPPAVGVLFRLNSSFDSQEQEQDMVRLVVAALTAVPGDAWLAFAGELTWLLRRGGQLTISEDGDFWTPDLVALLPPHERAHLPNL